MTTPKTPTKFKAVLAASVGNALEWYDFSIFIFFSFYISKNFFYADDQISNMLNTLIIFGMGFVARPLGALILGIYGDRVGRKAALTMTILIMALGTLIIAVTPSTQNIGYFATVLLLIGRLLQGFSAGGEIGSATAFLVESAPQEKRGLYSSMLQASMGVSNILAALVGVIVTSIFIEQEIIDWAWRIPFIIGLLIVPVGFYIRRNLDETQAFTQEHKQATKTPTRTLFKKYPKHVVAGILFSMIWTISVYTLIIYMPIYYSQNPLLKFPKSQIFYASLIGNVFLVIGSLVIGKLIDKIGMSKIMYTGVIVLGLISYPILLVLHANPTFAMLILVQSIFCISVSILAGVAPAALSTLFPVEVRSTGMSITYNLAAILFAGFTPALLGWAINAYTVFAPSIHLAFASIAGLIGVSLIVSLKSNSTHNG